MIIEVKRVKVSGALIKQMHVATLEQFEQGQRLGYVYQDGKPSFALILLDGEYYKFYLNLSLERDYIWRFKEKGIKRKVKTDDLAVWWEKYLLLKKEALLNHIYI